MIPELLQKYPNASFGFTGSRSVDEKSRKVEGYANNQRFRVYCGIIHDLIGSGTFSHFAYKEISGYLLINNRNEDVEKTERQLVEMFRRNYNDLPDV